MEEGAWKEDVVSAAKNFYEFFRAAFLRRRIKICLLLFFCVRLSALNEPMDAIVYGAAIGLGYAAMENIGYLNTGDPRNSLDSDMVKR